jgi:hypothetical protein
VISMAWSFCLCWVIGGLQTKRADEPVSLTT